MRPRLSACVGTLDLCLFLAPLASLAGLKVQRKQSQRGVYPLGTSSSLLPASGVPHLSLCVYQYAQVLFFCCRYPMVVDFWRILQCKEDFR